MHLNFTLPQVRARELAHAGDHTRRVTGVIGRPNPWWPGGPTTSDCVGYQTAVLGLRTGHESLTWLEDHPHMISIAAFRAHYQFPEVPAHAIQPGDLVISNWTGTTFEVNGKDELEPEHMEWDYSINRSEPSIVIVGANTGPIPGQPTPNGVWRKRRPLDGHILFGIRLPYKPEKPSLSRRHEVSVVATYVNEHVPAGLPRTSAAPGFGPDSDTGYEGHNYWVLVQTWGRIHGYYGSHFIIDGIPGPQSRIVEAAAYKAATAKK